MKLSTTALINAVRAHLSPTLAGTLPGVFTAMCGQFPDSVDDRLLGDVLMRAAFDFDCSPPQVEMTAVHLQFPDAARVLSPADALEHQLFGPWAQETLTGALAAPIIAGARASNMAPGAPAFVNVRVSESEGQFCGLATLQFTSDFGQGAVVWPAIVMYGPASEPFPLQRTVSWDSDALFRVGVGAAVPAKVPAPPRSGSGGMILAASSGAIH